MFLPDVAGSTRKAISRAKVKIFAPLKEGLTKQISMSLGTITLSLGSVAPASSPNSVQMVFLTLSVLITSMTLMPASPANGILTLAAIARILR